MTRTRFHQGLEELKQRLLTMGGMVEQAVDRAIEAYRKRDLTLCQQVHPVAADVDQFSGRRIRAAHRGHVRDVVRAASGEHECAGDEQVCNSPEPRAARRSRAREGDHRQRQGYRQARPVVAQEAEEGVIHHWYR